ncbi:MAG: hypothetical protein HY815_29805 [Candidatus Riflebacteria bacterium]|nr:hypothetical protein [Candidatus Riflebacteria bacterium]
MAFRGFSTDVADYLLLLEGHFRVTNQAEISAAVNDLDSVVLEHIELGGSALESARGMIYRAVNAFNPNVQAQSAQASGPGVEPATAAATTAPAATGEAPGPAVRRLPSPRDQLGELGDLIERRAQRTGRALACSIVDVNLTAVGLYGSADAQPRQN